MLHNAGYDSFITGRFLISYTNFLSGLGKNWMNFKRLNFGGIKQKNTIMSNGTLFRLEDVEDIDRIEHNPEFLESVIYYSGK